MIFRYWRWDGKATVINDVDRLVFNSLNGLSVRALVSGRNEWRTLIYESDFVQFTLAKE